MVKVLLPKYLCPFKSGFCGLSVLPGLIKSVDASCLMSWELEKTE